MVMAAQPSAQCYELRAPWPHLPPLNIYLRLSYNAALLGESTLALLVQRRYARWAEASALYVKDFCAPAYEPQDTGPGPAPAFQQGAASPHSEKTA